MPLDREDKEVQKWVNTLHAEATSEEDALILLAYRASKGPGVEPVEFSMWDDFTAWCDQVLGALGWASSVSDARQRPGSRGKAWIFGGGSRPTMAWTFDTYRAVSVDGDVYGATWVGEWGVNAWGGNGYSF